MPASPQSQAIVDQGRVLLGSLSILLYVSSVSSVDVGLRSGEIQAATIDPIVRSYTTYQALREEMRMQEAREEEQRLERQQEEIQVQSTNRVIINTNSSGSNTAPRVQQHNTLSPSGSSPGSVQQGSSATPYPTIDTEAMQRESEARMEAFRLESEARMKAAEEEGQRGLEEFRAQSELEREAFQAEYGFD